MLTTAFGAAAEEDYAMDLRGAQVTWLGHGTFKLRSPDGKIMLLDAWVQDNPACPENQKHVGKLDALLITHGHSDHTANAVAVAQESQPEHVFGNFELSNWLERSGVQHTIAMNKGGTVDLGWVKVTMVHADHTCSVLEGDRLLYAGEATGYVLRFPNGLSLYAAGDTNVFGDMRLICQLYQPQVAILPIGDFYTMGPHEAACATQLLSVPAVIPGHYGTFPSLTGTPAALREELGALGLGTVEVADSKPGQTIG
jgi:L-ascorbate metabolism protein UlaG (beta-lactamase superfamily)